MSEVLLHDIVSTADFAIWQCIARIVEYIFGSGRDGWTEEAANAVHRFCLRHNILLEESYGLRACTVVVHNLIHLKDCVHRFGSLDNYWCYVFERAVQRYTKTPHNCKNIEHTLAHFEVQREFLSSHSRQPPDSTLEPDVLRDTNGLVSFCIMLEFDSKLIYLDLVLVVGQDTSKCIYSEYRKISNSDWCLALHTD